MKTSVQPYFNGIILEIFLAQKKPDSRLFYPELQGGTVCIFACWMLCGFLSWSAKTLKPAKFRPCQAESHKLSSTQCCEALPCTFPS